MEIPMTSFLDFVLKSGSPKLTCARNIKEQQFEEYSPATDYYKRFREAVQEMHQGNLPKSDLAKTVGPLPPNKVENYNRMITGYKAFLGKKDIKWFKPIRKNWTHNTINVPINPEVGLEWGGRKYLIKLYLKSEKPSKDRLASILALMKNTISSGNHEYAVLDVRNSKLYLYDSSMDDLIPLVEGEAESLETILSRI